MCKVLIIDDEDAICKMILYALSRNGIDADIAITGLEGIQKFDQEHFDLVITDIVMPDVDGNGIASHIRNSQKSDTPVIGITGTAWRADESAFDAVFEKPFPIHQLMDAVTNFTDCLPQQITMAK